jgi:hypothetical protein
MARAITTEYCKGCDPFGVQLALERVFIDHETALQERDATIESLRLALAGLRDAARKLRDGAPSGGDIPEDLAKAQVLADTILAKVSE